MKGGGVGEVLNELAMLRDDAGRYYKYLIESETREDEDSC